MATTLTGFQKVVILDVLRLQEVRQDVLISPTFRPVLGRPVIVVMATAPDVHHAVDTGGAA